MCEDPDFGDAGRRAAEDSPLVSVIIANYNRWPLLRQAIESVIDQTFTDFELIVVDDGSVDGSPDLVEAHFPTVRVIRQANAERGASYNTGIRAARGRYVAFLDNDDLYEPWHLSSFSRTLRSSPDARLFACRGSLWDPLTGRRKLLLPFDPKTLPRACLVRTVIPYQAMVVERSALLEVGGLPEDRELMGCDDWLLLMNLAHHCRVHRMTTSSVLIRLHPGRSMNDLQAISDSREEATKRILRGELLRFGLDEDSRALIVAGTHRLTCAHRYAAGDMRGTRATARAACRSLGFRAGIRWTGRFWLQSWMGHGGSLAMRRLRDGVSWR